MADDAMQPPHLPHCAGIGLRLGGVIRRPPCHLIVRQDLDIVLPRELLDLQRVMIRRRQRLLEDQVDLPRRARLGHFQMPIVLDKCPDDIRLHLIEHLLVIVKDGSVRRPSLFGLGNQLGVGLRDAHQLCILAVEHGLQVIPDVGMHEADNGDLVILGTHRQRH